MSKDEWQSTEPERNGRKIRQERHITCVKMSPDKADEVSQVMMRLIQAICAFARHSTSLFSIHDSPADESMRSPSEVQSNPAPKSTGRSEAPRVKRRSSELSEELRPHPLVTNGAGRPSTKRRAGSSTREGSEPFNVEPGPSYAGAATDPEGLSDDDRRELMMEVEGE